MNNETDKALIGRLAAEYDACDQPTPIQFITNKDLDKMDAILSGDQSLEDADQEWLMSVLEKINILGKLSSDTHVFGVTQAHPIRKEKKPEPRLRGETFKPNYFDPAIAG